MRLQAFSEAQNKLRDADGPVQLAGCVESQKVQMMSQAGPAKTRLIVTYDEREARLILEDLALFSSCPLLFPEKDILFYQADTKSNVLLRERMRVFRALHEARSDPEKEVAVVTTPGGVMNALAPFELFEDRLLSLEEAAVVEPAALMQKLAELGYERTAKVEAPGEFAVHGGVFDIFDLTSESPVRLDFFDNEIDTIRVFDPGTQLSGERVGRVTVYPASELFLEKRELERGWENIRKDAGENLKVFREKDDLENGASLQNYLRSLEDEVLSHNCKGLLEGCLTYFYDETQTLIDYLPEGSVICLEEPNRIEGSARFMEEEFRESFEMRLKKGLALPKQGTILRSAEETFASLSTGRTVLFTGLQNTNSLIRAKSTYLIETQTVVSYQGNFQGLLTDLKRFSRLNYHVVLLCPSGTRAKRLAEEFRSFDIRADYLEDPDRTSGRDPDAMKALAGGLIIIRGSLHRGFSYPGLKWIVLTENDLYGGVKKKKRKIRSFSELSSGDYVVHENYGIGIYKGIKNISSDGVARDYMEISYGNSGTLYIPVTNLDVVQKYASADAKPPKINRLDSPDWKRTKSRVKAAVQEIADELVELYALRQTGNGHKYREDTVWQKEFEEMFPYEETDDQLAAIEDVKRDMESGKIMDRLICGDVGFGKTEVALRAAFKAVEVAYLVPTTILAQQHYNTFRQRLQGYPMTVEMMSRFRTESELKSTVKDLKDGTADIVIGTHRLLSNDVKFRRLGLLIIDEEQRFGVRHKEKIKQMKTNVDVLTLTATPIPRTLHMSMIGVRDMSVLSEPPQDRQAIQTYVMEFSEELVREAIHREVARGGQVYYVYNRVQDIDEVASKVQALCPEAVVSYAHGKMSEQALENRMLDFINGEIDVLVSTTIIETGLDIPNVNTIIIHDAERYGLSQLYQLRGRVGRSSRQAYAFIMYRKNRILSEDSQKRLEAIRQFTELGSGMKIAMQDLEIRGAGAVLGNAQSGHMAQVGYDLYCKLLSQAVRRSRSDEEESEPFETLLDIRVDAFIPPSYISDESLKLETYKKISLLLTEEDKIALEDELTDRYGDVPKQVENLMDVALLRVSAKELYFSEIKGNTAELTFRFVPDAKIRGENVAKLIAEMDGAMQFIPSDPISLRWHEKNVRNVGKTPILALLKDLLGQIKNLLIE